jgi:large subunit ribosomal protein L17
MRHRYYGSKLSRNTGERRRLFEGLVRDLFLYDRLQTTAAKAKAVQPMIDKLITTAKTGGNLAYRRVLGIFDDKQVTVRVLEYAKTRFDKRTSGFTRIYKVGPRAGDGTEVVLMRFVDEAVTPEPQPRQDKGSAKHVKSESKVAENKVPIAKKLSKTRTKKA